MPVDPRRRQRKLERNRAKEKARRREMVRREARSLAAQVKDAAGAPILHCCLCDAYWEHGIGNLLFSRDLGYRGVVLACFLIDRYCLGVKNAFSRFAPRSQYEVFYAKMEEESAMVPLRPESARKLVESAVQYAGDLGLSPHRDYHDAKHIFGDISAAASAELFEFGRNGKPHFFAGPHDSPARCRDILATLHAHCGPGGYTFVVGPSIAPPDSMDRPDIGEVPRPHILGERPALTQDDEDEAW